MLKTTRSIAALLFCALASLAHADNYTGLHWSIDRTVTPNEIAVDSADHTQRFNIFKLTAAGQPTPYFSSTFCGASEWITASAGVPSCSQPAFANLSDQATLAQLPTMAAGTVLANITGGSATPTEATPTNILDLIGSTRGSILYRGASGWAAQTPGNSGAPLLSSGAGADPNYGALNLAGGSNVVTGTLPTGNLPTAAASDVKAGTSSTKVVTPAALSGSQAVQTLTDGATINWDMSLGYNAKVTLGGNRTMAAPTNPTVGQSYTLQVIQDGTGSRTMTWNAAFDWGAAGTPTLSTTAGKIDLVTLICISASPSFIAVFNKGY